MTSSGDVFLRFLKKYINAWSLMKLLSGRVWLYEAMTADMTKPSHEKTYMLCNGHVMFYVKNQAIFLHE